MATRSGARARVPIHPSTAPAGQATVQRRPVATQGTEDPARGHDRARLGHRFDRVAPGGIPDVPVAAPNTGRPIPPRLRGQMETALKADLSDVRLHEGPEAERVGAIAYTRGAHIHFQPGRLSPDSPAGKRLLAHELTHVVQQRQGRVETPGGGGAPINDAPHLEAEADAVAARAAQGDFSPSSAANAGGEAAAAAANAPMQLQGDDEEVVTRPRSNAVTRPNGWAPAATSTSNAVTGLGLTGTLGTIGSGIVKGGALLGNASTGAFGPGGLSAATQTYNAGGLIGGITGAAGGTADVVGGIGSAVDAWRRGHTRAGLESGARIATGLGNVGMAGAQLANFGAHLSGAAGVAGTVAGHVIPGFNVALGGLDVISGTGQAIRSGLGKRGITNSLNQIREAGGNAELEQSLQYMHGVQNKVQNRGIFNAVAGGLQVAGGAMALSGVGLLPGAIVAGLGSGLKAARAVGGDLRQWAHDRVANNNTGVGGWIARNIFRGDATRSRQNKAAELDAHVDRLVQQHDNEHIHAALDGLGMSRADLEDFKKYKDLRPERQNELWGRIKGLHMKRQGGDQESYERGQWRSNLFSDKLGPGLSKVGGAISDAASSAWGGLKRFGSWVAGGARAAGSAIASGARTAGSAIASGAQAAWGGLKAGASWLGDRAVDAGHAIASGARTAGSAIASGARSAWGGIRRGAAAAAPYVSAGLTALAAPTNPMAALMGGGLLRRRESEAP